MTKVAIHQPNFLPWIGYFYKIHVCDVFIFLDDVQFIKRSYINRTVIARPDDTPHLLSIPLKKHSQLTNINKIFINHEHKTENIFETISRFYRKTRNEPLIGAINCILQDMQNYERLLDLNVALIRTLIAEWFPDKKVVFSSSFSLNSKGEQKIIDLVKIVGGNEYISGVGARSYQNINTFNQNKIKLNYVDYPNIFYNDGTRKLTDGYSIYDFIAYEGQKNPFIKLGNL